MPDFECPDCGTWTTADPGTCRDCGRALVEIRRENDRQKPDGPTCDIQGEPVPCAAQGHPDGDMVCGGCLQPVYYDPMVEALETIAALRPNPDPWHPMKAVDDESALIEAIDIAREALGLPPLPDGEEE